MNKKKWTLLTLSLLLVIAGWLASAFYGLPWKKEAIAQQLLSYLNEKYERDFKLEEAFYNFKDGSYGALFHPADDPSLTFYGEEGFAEYKYVDTYPEVIWARQLQKDINSFYKEIYPELDSVETHYVTYDSLDKVKGPAIPRYNDAEAQLGAHFTSNQPFFDSEDEWEKAAGLVHKVQSLSPHIDASFSFIDRTHKFEEFILCPTKSETEIQTKQQAKEACSANRYDLETGSSLDKE